MRVLAGAAVALAALAAPASADVCRADVADIRWAGGQAHFSVEIADDAAERAQGLMFRDKLASGRGMLFVYDQPQPVSFWMRNTLIPLDMVFFGEDGRVRSVHANAVPHDETPIPGGNDIQFVLEIAGGLAAKLGIAPGAELRHPAVNQRFAAWPCE